MSSGEIGFPQMDFTTYPSQMFWLAVAFTAMYLLMSKVALPGVEKVKKARKKIQNTDLSKAEAYNNEAEGLKTEYEQSMDEARHKSAETISAVEDEINNKLKEAQQNMLENANKRLENAVKEIASAQAETLKSIKDISTELSVEIVQKVAAIKTNNTDAKKIVTATIKDGA